MRTNITITGSAREPQTFRSAASALRWLLEAAARQTSGPGGLAHFYMHRPEHHGAFYFSQDTWLKIDPEDYAWLYRVLKRYQGFLHHMEEVDPEWYEESRTSYMDNSVEAIQRSRKYPERTRRVRLTAPSGDACY